MTSSAANDGRAHARILAAIGGVALAVVALAGCAPAGPGEVAAPETPTAEPTFSSDAPAESDPVGTDAPQPGATESEAPPVETAPIDDRVPVTVAVVGAAAVPGGIEVRSFVTDYVGEGTCRYLAVASDGTEVETEVEALPDAQSTVCPTTVVSGLVVDHHTLTVTFENDDRVGVSEPVVVEVVE